MNKTLIKYSVFALAPAAVIMFTSCSSTPKAPEGQSTTLVAAEKGVPGGLFVETYQTTATVTGIDASTRHVTLVTPDGRKGNVQVGPDVINFDQIKIGDQVKATVTEELAVYMAKAGTPPPTGEAALVALAPTGAKPGGVLANTVQITAKVKAIDVGKRKATLEFPDGSTKTFAVRQDIDLTKEYVGEEVVIRSTEAVAIVVEKP